LVNLTYILVAKALGDNSATGPKRRKRNEGKWMESAWNQTTVDTFIKLTKANKEYRQMTKWRRNAIIDIVIMLVAVACGYVFIAISDIPWLAAQMREELSTINFPFELPRSDMLLLVLFFPIGTLGFSTWLWGTAAIFRGGGYLRNISLQKELDKTYHVTVSRYNADTRSWNSLYSYTKQNSFINAIGTVLLQFVLGVFFSLVVFIPYMTAGTVYRIIRDIFRICRNQQKLLEGQQRQIDALEQTLAQEVNGNSGYYQAST
jgi:uncharacterized membrane protein (DUF485 family)